MTHFLQDILRQPDELQRTIDYLRGTGRRALADAAFAIRTARHVYLTGIGSSWHAALTAGPFFSRGGRPVYLQDASELTHFATIPPDSLVIIISRTGRSIEVVQLLAKAREAGAFVIGLTNSLEGPLAQEAQIPIVINAKLDHAVSVNTYSTLSVTAAALGCATVGFFDDSLAAMLAESISGTSRSIPEWQRQIAESRWLMPGSISYFLGRGSSLGSCHEARLLWEEGVKSPATAMGTGVFRHGPQEMIAEGARFALWIDSRNMREQDLAIARDLRQLGVSVMVVGRDIPEDAGDVVFRLPAVPCDWQFMIDIIPVQLAAERLAGLSGVDCDSFRLCSYIVENDWGLLGEKVTSPKLKA